MDVRRVALVMFGWWFLGLVSSVSLMGVDSVAGAETSAPPLLVLFAPPGMGLVGLALAAILFLALWLSSSSRERKHFNERHSLQLGLLSKTEELAREKATITEVQATLRAHAIRDELTGLPNRTSIIEVLDREMARSVRDKSTLSVVLADVDYLGKVNEAHGEAAGDEVLKEIARRIEQAIRSYDTAGRYSGGEFLLILPSFEADTGVERLRKIHDSLCGQPIAVPSGSLTVTCSFGVSILLPNQFYSSEELLQRANQAVATAKQDGRNRIGFFARSGS